MKQTFVIVIQKADDFHILRKFFVDDTGVKQIVQEMIVSNDFIDAAHQALKENPESKTIGIQYIENLAVKDDNSQRLPEKSNSESEKGA